MPTLEANPTTETAATSTGTNAGANATTGTSGGASPVQTSQDWRSSLPDDIRNEPSIGAIKAANPAEALAAMSKAYVHGQKLIGADKLVLPKADAPPEAWGEVWNRLGRPASPEGYRLPEQLPEGIKVDQKQATQFAAEAHRLGLTGQQYAGLARYEIERQMTAQKLAADAARQNSEKSIESLRAEWGDAFDQNAAIVHEAAKRFGGDQFIERMKQLNLDNDPAVVGLLFKVGKMISQDEVHGRGGRAGSIMSPADAIAEINRLQNDPEFTKAHLDSRHPRSEESSRRWSELHRIAYPGTQRSI